MFKAFFNSKSGYAYSIHSSETGLNDLDQIREETGISALDPAIVDSTIQGTYGSQKIYLSEDEARRSGLFLSQNEVTVETKPKFLNQFFFKKYYVNRNSQTGAVTAAGACWDINKDELKEAWQQDGYPVRWGFDDEAQEDY